LDRAILDDVLESIGAAAEAAGVAVVTGDTKVVGGKQADGMYITTAGVGAAHQRARVHPSYIRPGDAILVNGPIADHGLAVMLAREMPEVTSTLRSDVAPMNRLTKRMLKQVPGITFMRDPTRGGLAGLCADVAARTGSHIAWMRKRSQSAPRRVTRRRCSDSIHWRRRTVGTSYCSCEVPTSSERWRR
jgi:hydrogenase expression/formation protein HypE